MRKLFYILAIYFFSYSSLSALENKIETADQLQKIFNSVVQVESFIPPEARTAEALGTQRKGSGVIIDDNHILTIGYIVVEAENINITLSDGKKIPGELAGYDSTTGFGILKTAIPLKLDALEFGDSDKLTKEEMLFIIPHLNEGKPSAANMVSRRPFVGWWEYFLDKPIYTFPMNYSWAGAPLINQYGKILGIGSLYVTEAYVEGMLSPGNLFIPINDLKPIFDDLIQNGRRTKDIKPYMGLSSQINSGKISVTRVNENGPAAKAGIMEKDIILSINNKKIKDMEDFYKTVWSSGGPGSKLNFEIERSQKKINLEIITMDRNDFYLKPKYY